MFFSTSMILINFIASDFLPTLNEGDIVFNLVAQDSTSLSKTVEICKNIEKKILETEIAKCLMVNKAGISNVSTTIKKVSDQYSKGAKVL
jgi:Cu/Ag efflux pump CusA